MSITRGLILDIDGTLIDSNESHALAWRDALEEVGVAIDLQRLRRMIGMGGDKLVPALDAGLVAHEGRGEHAAKRQAEIFEARYLEHVPALPGAREMVMRFKSEHVKVAVATSSSQQLVDKLLGIAGVLDLIEKKTDADDVDASKPSPDVVHVAMRRIGVDAAHAVMIGDTPYDVAAATRAHVPAIAFRSGRFWTDDELAGARALFDGPADLVAHWPGIDAFYGRR